MMAEHRHPRCIRPASDAPRQDDDPAQVERLRARIAELEGKLEQLERAGAGQ